MPMKCDQPAKDRVIRLIGDRILAEYLSLQVACQEVGLLPAKSADTPVLLSESSSLGHPAHL
ncbi:hypothetical protein CPELA_10790 [Corynebacterium pelargi]|uniref:Uncharacterized protein n=1 Tax=Corynebacterium pelargi TaxID=1471400 RepID=A0A410WBS6_9CORY|nr:hypothetical protein CPELA_10790 [Corynebacterium pelargi]